GRKGRAASKKAPAKTKRGKRVTRAPGRMKAAPSKEVRQRASEFLKEPAPGHIEPPPEEFREPERGLQETPELPQGYGETRVVLMVVDPHWVHAYWEITDGSLSEAKDSLGERYESASRVLRVRRMDEAAEGGEILEQFYIEIGSEARNWYLRVPRPDSSYQVDIGLLARDGEFYLFASSNMVRVPRAGMSDVIDEKWANLEEGYYEKIYALSGGFQVGMGSLELQEKMAELLREEIASGAVGSFALGSGAIGARRQRAFWFRVGAELIVYGATDPRAKVTLMGEPLKLRNDGTFTIRFALPDGVRNIPITAESPDGVEAREIELEVTKETSEREPVVK
ncbi:MAG: DUF4912 domain-containing protein, partial [Candidatus Glassbacteria bacterium]